MDYTVFSFLLIGLTSYLLGCLNGAIFSSKFINKTDVREYGSKNAGLTNYIRSFGLSGFWVVLAIDGLKGVASCYIAMMLMTPLGLAAEGMMLAVLFCIIGHCFPVFFDFKGGKGVLTAVFAILFFDWRIACVVIVVFALTVLLSKMVSLGSVLAATAFPLFVAAFMYNTAILIMSIVAGGLVIFMHRGNIKRISTNTESKINLSKKKPK